jgi:PIN domain nuclease of toxin-antitoxin system
MRILLDTHAFLWWLDGDRKISRRVRGLIEDEENAIYVSAASAWEIATKARIGKLPGALHVARRLPEEIADQGFTTLSVSIQHGQRAGWLPSAHRDPFDRMLAAQAIVENMQLASNEEVLDGFGVERIW